MKRTALVGVFGIVVGSVSGCAMIQERLGPIAPVDMLSAGQDLVKATQLTDQEVATLCHDVAVESDKQNEIADSSSVYAKRLANIIRPHLNEEGLRLNYKVYVSDDINAFSLADGTIRVNSGLMDVLDDKELLAVIGHEIGHVKLGHSKAHMQRSYAASAALKTTSASINAGSSSTVGGVAGAVGANALANITAEVIKAQFSQSDETEADEYSLEFLERHHNNPRSLVVALSKIHNYSEESDASFMAQFVSSHPGTEARIEHIEQVLGNTSVAKAQASHETATTESFNDEEESQSVAHYQEEEEFEPTEHEQVLRLNPAPVQQAQHDEETPAIQSEKQAVSAGWYVQLAALTDSSSADEMKDALHERRVKALTQTALVNGVEYHRVLVGPYAKKKDAQAQLTRASSHGIFEGEPFIRRLPTE